MVGYLVFPCNAVAVEISCIDRWWWKDGDIIVVNNSQRWFVYGDIVEVVCIW